MSGVMNFNSFTPRHARVVGEARRGRWGGRRVQATGAGEEEEGCENGGEFFARQIVDRLD